MIQPNIRKRLQPLLLLIIAALTLCSCERAKYRIGVSLCFHNDWNAQLAKDLQRGANSHPEIELIIRHERQSVENQINDVRKLIADKVDLIIISPEEAKPFIDVIDEATAAGIPTIFLDSELPGSSATAFICVDNLDIGHCGGRYAVVNLEGKGKIISVMGNKGASATIDRHEGFREMLSNYPEMVIVDSIYTEWTYESAYHQLDSVIKLHPDVDMIAAHSDPVALAAHDVCVKHHIDPMPLILGVDGLSGKGNGIESILKGKITATSYNPTGGEDAIQIALKILEGKPYDRVTKLRTQLVDANNVRNFILQEERIDTYNQRIEEVNGILGRYLQRTTLMQLIISITVFVFFLIIGFVFFIIRSMRQRAKLRLEVEEANAAKLTFFTNVSHSFRTPLTLIADPIRTMQQEGDLSPRQVELLEMMQKQSDVLLRLVDKVLNVLQDDMLKDGRRLDAVAQQSAQTTTSASDLRNKTYDVHPDLETDEGRKTVLVIEDNADVRRYVSMLLEKENYLVLTAPNGAEGLQVAQQNIPDLIVSDVMMPVMDGLECCRLLKAGQATSHIPVLLLTAYALDDQRIQGYQSGADAYITKPFNADVLCARIANLIASRKHIDTSNDRYQEMERAEFSSVDRGFINHMHSYVTEHLADADLDVQQLSKEFGMSRVQLYRKCKSITNQSPVEIIRIIRLKAATQLLKTTDKTVAEIAYEVGFSSPSYFAKCYKDQYNVSPTDIQKQRSATQ